MIGGWKENSKELSITWPTSIQLGFTDTYSANSAQAFALTENNLYTTDAFEEYLDHLRPGGILSVSRPNRSTGNEAVRATGNAAPAGGA